MTNEKTRAAVDATLESLKTPQTDGDLMRLAQLTANEFQKNDKVKSMFVDAMNSDDTEAATDLALAVSDIAIERFNKFASKLSTQPEVAAKFGELMNIL